MSEGRVHKRYEVDLLDVTIAIIHASNIEIIDISLDGIALLAPKRLNIGEQYDVKIQSKGKALNIKGIVIWSNIDKIHKGLNSDAIPVYKAGLEFVDVSKYLEYEIDNFIKAHKRDKDTEDDTVGYDLRKDSRHYPRFQVNTPVGAFIIDKTQCHPVKDLSFGGLCVECKQPMKINSTIPMMLNFSEDKFVVFKGKIASCHLNKKASPRLYTIGIEISEMSTEDRKTLTEHIRLLNTIDTSPPQ